MNTEEKAQAEPPNIFPRVTEVKKKKKNKSWAIFGKVSKIRQGKDKNR